MQKFWKLIAGLGVAMAAAYYFLVAYVAPGYIRAALPVAEQLAAQYINGSVQLGGISWHGGLTAELERISFRDSDGALVAEVPQAVIHLRPWLALGNAAARAVSGIELRQPRVHLAMAADGKWNLQHFLKTADSGETPFYGLLEISGGTLEVAMPCGKWAFTVDGSVNGGANPKFAVDAVVTTGEDRLTLKGLLTAQALGSLAVDSERLHLAPYGALAEYFLAVQQLGGELEGVRLNWQNDGSKVHLSGEGLLRDVSAVASAGEQQIALSDCSGLLRAVNSKLTLPGLDFALNGQQLRLTGEADLENIRQPKGQGVLSAAVLEWQGRRAANFQLPFRFEGNSLFWEKAALSYGGGRIISQGACDLAAKAVSATLKAENVTQALPGRAVGKAVVNGELGLLLAQDGEKISVHAAGNTMGLQWRSLLINSVALDGDFDGGRVNVEHFSAFSDIGSLAAAGSIALDGSLRLAGRMSEFPIDAFLEAMGQQGKGFCSMGFTIGGSLAAPEFSGMVQLLATEYMQQKIKEAHGLLSLKNNILSFHNFGYAMEQGSHLLNGTLDFNADEPLMDFEIATKNVRAEPVMAVLAPEIKLTGNVDNVFKLRGTLAHPYVYGDICLSYGSINGYLLDKVAGRYAYEDGRLALNDFVIDALSTEIRLAGVMDQEQRLNFSMDARNISLERLPIMEKDLALSGFANAQGQLTGTLRQPHFAGSVSSERLSVNGGLLTELAGSLVCNGRELNELKASFRQPYADGSDYGILDASLNLNLTEQFLSGKVAIARGELGAILKMCKQDYDIDGIVQGDVEINRQGKGSGVQFMLLGEQGRVHDLNYYRMVLNGHVMDKILYFDDFQLRERADDSERGMISLGGKVDFARRFLDVKLEAAKANPAIVTALMADPTQLEGEMDLLLQARGSFDNPTGSGSLSIVNGAVSGVSIDQLDAALSLEDDTINLEYLTAAKDAYNVRASGTVPLDLFRPRSERRNPQAQMQIAMDLSEARLGMLPALTQMVEWGSGDTDGQVILSGTLEEPLLNGHIRIDEGSVKLKYLHTVLDKIHTDIEFEGSKIILHDLSAQLGKGRIAMAGSYALRVSEGETYSLRVLAEDAELASEIFTGRLNGDLEIVPQRYLDFRAPRGNGPPPRLYRPQLKGSLRLDDVLINMPTVPELGEGSANLGLDLQVLLGPKIHLFNKYLYDMWLGGSVHLKGSTVHPQLEGQVRADRGSVTYLRTHFKLRSAYAGWPLPGTFLPTVNMDGEARFSRYTVFVRVSGPMDAMELKLTSNPPLEQNTIIRMLTLQRDMSLDNEANNDDMQDLLNVGLQMTVLGNVEMMVKQTLGLDQFRVYNGKVRTGLGFESVRNHGGDLTDDDRNKYNVLVSKYLTRHLLVGYTSSFDGIDRSVFGQYDINRHLSITYSRSYYSYAKGEDWYGLEYRTTFN